MRVGRSRRTGKGGANCSPGPGARVGQKGPRPGCRPSPPSGPRMRASDARQASLLLYLAALFLRHLARGEATSPRFLCFQILSSGTFMPDSVHAPLDVVTCGEAMALFVAAQAGSLERVADFRKLTAGAELNVAIGLARLGFPGRLPEPGRPGCARRFLLAALGRGGHRPPPRGDRRRVSDRPHVQDRQRRRQRSPGRILPARLGGEPAEPRRLCGRLLPAGPSCSLDRGSARRFRRAPAS